MTVPYIFATATTSIPLSQLDSNFATPVTLGNTAVYLGNTTSSIGNIAATNTTITTIQEPASISATASTGTINFDCLSQAILYYTTNASANWTINFRGNGSVSLDSMMAVNNSLSVSFLATQGATPYYANAFQIDGSSVVPKWQGGAAPSAGNASGIDVYTFNIIKTASATFTVLAAQTQFK
jgi:hypothetical protein